MFCINSATYAVCTVTCWSDTCTSHTDYRNRIFFQCKLSWSIKKATSKVTKINTIFVTFYHCKQFYKTNIINTYFGSLSKLINSFALFSSISWSSFSRMSVLCCLATFVRQRIARVIRSWHLLASWNKRDGFMSSFIQVYSLYYKVRLSFCVCL